MVKSASQPPKEPSFGDSKLLADKLSEFTVVHADKKGTLQSFKLPESEVEQVRKSSISYF